MPEEKQILSRLVSTYLTFKAVGVGPLPTPKKTPTGGSSGQSTATPEKGQTKPSTPK